MTISDVVVSRRTAALLVGLGLVLVGCGQHVPLAPPTPPTPPPTTPGGPSTGPAPTPKEQATSLRQRLADAVRAQDPDEADLVENRLTDVTAVEAPWLPGWQVVDVSYRGVPHGRRFYVGLADDGRVTYLAGKPDAFNAMIGAAGVEVADAGTATALAQVLLDATRTFVHYAYRVEGIDDVSWLPGPDAQEQAERRRVERAYRSRITRPAARQQGDGWTLTLWTVDDRSLVEHALVVSRAGQVSDRARTVEPRLPVPESR